MSHIDLRPYDLTNIEEVTELVLIINEYYQNSPWPPSVEKVMKGGVTYFRAFYNGQQIGLTGHILITPQLAETVKTTIFKEWRGQKLGALLSQAIEDECRRLGVKKVRTTIYYFNHAMVSIKLKQGYTIEGFHPDHEAPGYHEYSLGKILL